MRNLLQKRGDAAMPKENLLPTERRDLGNGLSLRWSNTDDTEEIAYLASSVFRDGAGAPINVYMANLIRELMSGNHPLMGSGDFVVVEDTQRKEHPFVACTCFWSQTWEFEGIPFQFGRPEIVATDPAYRNRGLVRAIFEVIHARSEAEGHLAQAITGIRYFYRQFGYEYALDLGGRSITYLSLIPHAKEGAQEPYTLRDAVEEDIPLIRSLYDRRKVNSIVWSPLEDRWLRYHIHLWKTLDVEDSWHVQMIVDTSGVSKGFLLTPIIRWDQSIAVFALEVVPDLNLQEVLPVILRAIHTQGLQVRAQADAGLLTEIHFNLGQSHPVYDALGNALAPKHIPPYAWYVRVANLPGFIQHIAPALERRLANSPLGSYNGELKLDFYRGGLRMVFEHGRLTVVENWQRSTWEYNENAAFPPLVFLQLLFGYRSLDDLRYAFPDVKAKDESELVLNVLFPARPSWALPIG
jgi:GNAT superfamily N-acetyltransferase